MQQVSKNIFVETAWPGANASYIVTTQGLILVDTPYYPSYANQWKNTVEKNGSVIFLINTESHDDHYASNFLFNVPVIAHKIARDAMIAADVNQIAAVISQNDPASASLLKDLRINTPAITFTDQMNLYSGNQSFQLFFTPGHSAGQITIFVPEERVVFTGDNVCNRIQGFFHEADPYAWLESLKRIGELDFDYIVPGHGLPCKKDYLGEETEFVQSCIDKTVEAIRNGWSKDEAISRVSFERYPLDLGLEEYGKVLLQKSVQNMYEFLSQKQSS